MPLIHGGADEGGREAVSRIYAMSHQNVEQMVQDATLTTTASERRGSMRQQRDVSIHSRMIKWSLLTTTKGLSAVWVSSKAYDVAAARLIKAARGAHGKELLKTRSAPLRIDLRPARTRARRASSTNGCSYVVTPEVLNSIEGLAQVWVSAKVYDALAAGITQDAKNKYATQLLRRRMAPLGFNAICKGRCYGGWCKEIPMPSDIWRSPRRLSASKPLPRGNDSAVFICECSYFV